MGYPQSLAALRRYFEAGAPPLKMLWEYPTMTLCSSDPKRTFVRWSAGGPVFLKPDGRETYLSHLKAWQMEYSPFGFSVALSDEKEDRTEFGWIHYAYSA